MDLLTWVCWDSIFSRDCGIGSLQKKSWLRAVSESILAEGSRVRKTQKIKTSVCYLAEGLRVSSLSKRSTAHWSFTYGFNLSLTRLYIM